MTKTANKILSDVVMQKKTELFFIPVPFEINNIGKNMEKDKNKSMVLITSSFSIWPYFV